MSPVSAARTRPVAAVSAASAVLVALATAACAPPVADTTHCQPVPPSTLAAVAGGLRVASPATLRHGYLAQPPGSPVVFVSAELHLTEDRQAKKGDVLTWAVTEPGRFASVDQNARRKSSWPPAAFDVRKAGAMQSRACTAAKVGHAGA